LSEVELCKQAITRTQTIEFSDGFTSFTLNECVPAFICCVLDQDGKVHRWPNGTPFSFDDIWNDILEMENDQYVEGTHTGTDILRCRLRELEQEFPDKAPQELREGFRMACARLYELSRLGALSNKQFIGTSADRLEDFKKNGIPHNEGIWLTEEEPWNAEGCHPWSGSWLRADDESDDDDDESEEERKPVRGLILEVDLSQLSNNCIFPEEDGSLTYAGMIPWSAVTRYAILDWEEIDEWWAHFVTHRMPGSPQNAPFTRWVMGYPVTVADMVWPLQRGYKAEDTSPESNRAWTRYEWDGTLICHRTVSMIQTTNLRLMRVRLKSESG
jgi:hypothetical protein